MRIDARFGAAVAIALALTSARASAQSVVVRALEGDRGAVRDGIVRELRRHDLDVFDLPIAVRPLVLNPNVGEMDVAVDHGKVTTSGPLRDIGGMAVGILFLPAALPLQAMEEPLIVPLQLVVEDDAGDNRALLFEALD